MQSLGRQMASRWAGATERDSFATPPLSSSNPVSEDADASLVVHLWSATHRPFRDLMSLCQPASPAEAPSCGPHRVDGAWQGCGSA